jgi:hypothetical protein
VLACALLSVACSSRQLQSTVRLATITIAKVVRL